MKKVFEKAELGNLKLKNRLIRSATWEGIALPNGGVTEEAYEIYGELAKGGVGATDTFSNFGYLLYPSHSIVESGATQKLTTV